MAVFVCVFLSQVFFCLFYCLVSGFLALLFGVLFVVCFFEVVLLCLCEHFSLCDRVLSGL